LLKMGKGVAAYLICDRLVKFSNLLLVRYSITSLRSFIRTRSRCGQ